MKVISTVLISVCVSCIFMGAVQILCPKGNMEKSVKYLVSLAFLVMIISCGGINMNFQEFKIPIENRKTESLEEMDKKTAEYVISSLLEKSNIKFEEIDVYMDKSKDNSIVISKVLVKTNAKRETVVNALGEISKNFMVEVINE